MHTNERFLLLKHECQRRYIIIFIDLSFQLSITIKAPTNLCAKKLDFCRCDMRFFIFSLKNLLCAVT